MAIKFWIRATTSFDGTLHLHKVELLANEAVVVAQETGMQSNETGYPNAQSLTEKLLAEAHYNLTGLRQKMDPSWLDHEDEAVARDAFFAGRAPVLLEGPSTTASDFEKWWASRQANKT